MIRYKPDGGFPAEELAKVVFESLRARKQSRVAIMEDAVALDSLPRLGSQELNPEKDYQWSGILIQRRIQKPPRRVIYGEYAEWFKWYMRHQRFRTFHTVILIDPLGAISDKEHGGYIDGLLARLMGKACQVVVVTKTTDFVSPPPDEPRVTEVLRALLYGTRLTRPELIEQAGCTFIPIPKETLVKTLERYKWRISKHHPRLCLKEFDEELVQGMVASVPKSYIDGKPNQIEQLFKRESRFKRELMIPDEMLGEKAFDDVRRLGWVTVPYEADKTSTWLDGLNKARDSRLEAIYRRQEYVRDEQWLGLLSPTRSQVRRVLEGLVTAGRLETRPWFREVGRPARAYVLPGKAPFLEERCGQCAFYVSLRRRCRLWWLVNKKRVFYDERWKQTESQVSRFDIHKMRYASRIGPHSSACTKFIDKKRDHLRKAVPVKCEICGEAMLGGGVAVTCRNCRTRYVRFRNRVKVMTAYEHEYERMYREITGGDAKADLEAWKRDMAERLPRMLERKMELEDLDMLADEAREREEEPPRLWPRFDQALQENVDWLAQSSDIARQLSIAMAQSALNATRRIVAFAKLDERETGPTISLQEKYLALITDAAPSGLLTYEALMMKQYWFCYNLVLKKAQQWFGPRKKSRFVREFVENPAGRARGYSAVDAAINYLHQRRLRQAERINAEVGFAGTCDGFLHRERYNSRRIGLLLDMIDPFKFADREVLLSVVLNRGMSWRDFKLETDRRGSTYYYPAPSGKTILDRISVDADETAVWYEGREKELTEAYRASAQSFVYVLEGQLRPEQYQPFVFVSKED